jgi:hypothetical protein
MEAAVRDGDKSYNPASSRTRPIRSLNRDPTMSTLLALLDRRFERLFSILEKPTLDKRKKFASTTAKG